MLSAAAMTNVALTLDVASRAAIAGNVRRAKVKRAPMALTAVAAATPIATFSAPSEKEKGPACAGPFLIPF